MAEPYMRANLKVDEGTWHRTGDFGMKMRRACKYRSLLHSQVCYCTLKRVLCRVLQFCMSPFWPVRDCLVPTDQVSVVVIDYFTST